MLVLALAAPGAIPARGAGIKTEKYALASWLRPTQEKNHFRWFFAAGATDVRVGGREEPPFATFGKGMCVIKKKKKFLDITCSARSQAGAEGPSAFEMDPAATEARLRVRKRGVNRTARIVAGEPSDDSLYRAGVSCGTGGGAGIFRFSDATSRMFGRRFTTSRRYDSSMMMSGALVDACDSPVALFADLTAGRQIQMRLARN
jgi:hypothetical protein